MKRTIARPGPAAAWARLAALVLLVGAVLLTNGAPAAAASTISINPGNVPTTAANFTQNCDPNLGGGPFANEDVWVFNLPGNPQTSGTFQSVTATFSTPGGPVTRTIPTDPNSAIVNNLGTSKAWIRLPAGWTLTGATAVISGTADFFVLTHTCAASNPQVNPKLALTKTGSPATHVKAGQTVTYTYTVTNQSTGTTDPITNITVTDDKVTGITCQDTSLAPGESTTCTGTYTVTEQDVKNGKIVNTAQAFGLFGEQTVPSNKATFTVTTKPKPPAQVSLSIDKKARVESDCRHTCDNDGYAAKGDKIFYTYRVTNTGTVTITDVAVDDPTAGPVVCNNTTLAPGTSTDCHAVNPHVVDWADVKKGKVVNTARATGKYNGKTVVSDPDTVTICIRDGKYDHRKHDKDGKKELPVTGDRTASTLSLGGGLLTAGALMLGATRLRRKDRIHA
ncbi:LPXTG cell wall anchor domain-containing protein [Micromonospora orduensis]|uniref:LPXTG cell wall anchor domain-containing protein n=1 Tax=Micromonospora orduensis TaxID=1420891 RepID=A0A5C4QI47_9ACTN|nr:LPXTG cell wall anchor domain-containing protein [Micromonospora orduensis]TNH23971.1 LPXTG cell wall anchor domain-containing protein [Micromonospora orduensis]